MNNQNLERELERIRNKWTIEIVNSPAWVDERRIESAEPIQLFLYMLVQQCIKYEVLVKSPPEGWGEYLGGMLANLTGTSVVLGLEFHSKDQVKNNDIKGMVSLAYRAQPLLNESLKDISESFKILTLGLVVKNVIDEESSIDLSGKFGTLCTHCKMQCFKAGIQLGNEFG